ncbi:hypothetical protein [Candidatus Borreliella tachyglossi]|uniref:hypothetical protein n=1 Tax=Candidatus Borreliella tachyglossi TaxID=1964448 RepID=UPI004043857D
MPVTSFSAASTGIALTFSAADAKFATKIVVKWEKGAILLDHKFKRRTRDETYKDEAGADGALGVGNAGDAGVRWERS